MLGGQHHARLTPGAWGRVEDMLPSWIPSSWWGREEGLKPLLPRGGSRQAGAPAPRQVRPGVLPGAEMPRTSSQDPA